MARLMPMGLVLLVVIILVTFIFYFYWNVSSEILVSDHMNDFIDTVDRHKAADGKKLVIFDLDDTVFMSSQLLGTPTWYYTMINLMRQSGAAQFEAYEVVSTVDKIVQEHIGVVPVEQATLSAIRTWQRRGMIVVAYTSRPVDMATITNMQLDQIDLSFWSPYLSCVEDDDHEVDEGFIDGVIYSGSNQKKHRALFAFADRMRRCGLSFEVMALADDQQRYIAKAADFSTKNHIDFIGIIYGGALSSRIFDAMEARRQLLSLEQSIGAFIIPREYRYVFLN